MAHPEGTSPVAEAEIRRLIVREEDRVKYATTCTAPTSEDAGIVSDEPFHAGEPVSCARTPGAVTSSAATDTATRARRARITPVVSSAGCFAPWWPSR